MKDAAQHLFHVVTPDCEEYLCLVEGLKMISKRKIKDDEPDTNDGEDWMYSKRKHKSWCPAGDFGPCRCGLEDNNAPLTPAVRGSET